MGALVAKKRRAKKSRKKKKKRQSRIVTAMRFLGFGVVLAIAASLFWTNLYGVISPPGTILMVQRKLGGDEISKSWKSLDEISPYLVTAVIAAEDTRFCMHNGIDFEAIDKALEESKNGRGLRGASTISQQTAKNAFLWNGGGWFRKGGEAWMTVLIETFWPKHRIVEVYLNVAEWGDGIFGAEAAAQARFGKSAADLTQREAALLASVLPNPHKWRVDPPGPYVRQRAGTVQARMNNVRRDGLDACAVKGN